MNKTFVYFAIFNFGDDPRLVTEVIGIEPTQAWVKGQPYPNTPKSIATEERWVLQSRLAPSGSIEEQLEELLLVLESRANEVKRAGAMFKTALRVAGYFYDTCNPGWELSAGTVKRLAALNLLIDFDIYCLCEKGPIT